MAYRRALITGATSGIGAAFAEALPAETHLLLTGRDAARLAALRERLGGGGREVDTCVADLAQREGQEALVDWAQPFDVDLLINNAGVGRFGRFVENPAAREREMAEVNVVAPVVITRALLPGMIDRAQSEGRRAGLVVVASVAAFQPLPYLSTYAASKAFDLMFAEGIAEELRREPVDVLALCPGPTATAFFERAGAGSSGFSTVSADRVARDALRALGRVRILVTDPVRRVTMAPGLLKRRALARAAEPVMRRYCRASADPGG